MDITVQRSQPQDPWSSKTWPARVPGREEIGTVIDSRNIGKADLGVSAHLIYFEGTGECVWYAAKHVTRVQREA